MGLENTQQGIICPNHQFATVFVLYPELRQWVLGYKSKNQAILFQQA
jgi:hypothetical protein